MLTCLLAVAVVAGGRFEFPGGTDAELVAAVSKELDAPVLMNYDVSRRNRKLDIDYPDRARLISRLKNVLGLEARGTVFAIPSAFAKDFFFYQRRSAPDARLSLTGQVAVKPADDGKLALRYPKPESPLTLRALLKPRKIQNLHWFLADAQFAVAGKEVNAKDAEAAALFLLGAKRSGDETGVSLEPDFSPFRSRLIAAAAAFSKGERDPLRSPSEFALLAELLKLVDKRTLQAVFESPSGEALMQIPTGTKLQALAFQKLRERTGADAAEPTQVQLKLRDMIESQADLAKPMSVYLRADLIPLIRLSGKEPGWAMSI